MENFTQPWHIKTLKMRKITLGFLQIVRSISGYLSFALYPGKNSCVFNWCGVTHWCASVFCVSMLGDFAEMEEILKNTSKKMYRVCTMSLCAAILSNFVESPNFEKLSPLHNF